MRVAEKEIYYQDLLIQTEPIIALELILRQFERFMPENYSDCLYLTKHEFSPYLHEF